MIRRFAQPPAWAVDEQCAVCDYDITEGAVAGEEDFDERGFCGYVAHADCYDALQNAKADAFEEAAKLVEHNDGATDLVMALRARASHTRPTVKASR